MSEEEPQAGAGPPARLWSLGESLLLFGPVSTSEKGGAGLDDFSGPSGLNQLGFWDDQGPCPQPVD